MRRTRRTTDFLWKTARRGAEKGQLEKGREYHRLIDHQRQNAAGSVNTGQVVPYRTGVTSVHGAARERLEFNRTRVYPAYNQIKSNPALELYGTLDEAKRLSLAKPVRHVRMLATWCPHRYELILNLKRAFS